MPIYEYKCLDCGETFEVFQKITEEPLNACTFCNGKVQKLISLCSFHLKGTGWYATDYRKQVDTSSEKREKEFEKEKKDIPAREAQA